MNIRAYAAAKRVAKPPNLVSDKRAADQTRSQATTGSVPTQAFLTIAEVAQLIRVSERTVRRRIKDGAIKKAAWPGRNVRVSAEELTNLFGGKLQSEEE